MSLQSAFANKQPPSSSSGSCTEICCSYFLQAFPCAAHSIYQYQKVCMPRKNSRRISTVLHNLDRVKKKY